MKKSWLYKSKRQRGKSGAILLVSMWLINKDLTDSVTFASCLCYFHTCDIIHALHYTFNRLFIQSSLPEKSYTSIQPRHWLIILLNHQIRQLNGSLIKTQTNEIAVNKCSESSLPHYVSLCYDQIQTSLRL